MYLQFAMVSSDVKYKYSAERGSIQVKIKALFIEECA